MGDSVAVTRGASISDNILDLGNDSEKYLHTPCGLRKGCHILKLKKKKLKLIKFYSFKMFEKAVRECNEEVFDCSTSVLHTI